MPDIIPTRAKRGCSSVVEHLLAKEDVASSSLVTRSPAELNLTLGPRFGYTEANRALPNPHEHNQNKVSSVRRSGSASSVADFLANAGSEEAAP
jgi:hypothetical protein